MIVRRKDRIIVLGITGKQGTFWTEKMIAYGSNVVAGVNPKRAGEMHIGVPIFASTAEAVAKVGGDVAVMFIPPPMAKEAAVSAAQAGIKLLVVLTEHIPAQDVMAMHAAAAKHGTRIVGPNTAGLVTPGRMFRRHHAGLRAERVQAGPRRRDLAQREPRHAGLSQPDARRARPIRIHRHWRRSDARHHDARCAAGAR